MHAVNLDLIDYQTISPVDKQEQSTLTLLSLPHTHTPTHEIKSEVTSTWYTIDNADAVGTVTFKPYNSKSI